MDDMINKTVIVYLRAGASGSGISLSQCVC
jgi:hypothetical protein